MARHSYKEKRKPEDLPSLTTLSKGLFEAIERLGLSSAVGIPITVFDNEELSALETIVKYLKENLRLRFSEIATLLSRDERNIWTTYKQACLKKKEMFVIKQVKFFVPLTTFQDRKMSVLESLVEYLKEQKQLSLHEIALLLNRNDRTIWTVYNRAQGKRKVIV